MSRHVGDRTLAQRAGTQPAELLIPVWVSDSGRSVPGVLLSWARREGTWWGLVAWDVGRGHERLWLPVT